jgi:hypothetical protein
VVWYWCGGWRGWFFYLGSFLFEREATIVVGDVAGLVIGRGETAVDGNGVTGAESMMLQVLLCT